MYIKTNLAYLTKKRETNLLKVAEATNLDHANLYRIVNGQNKEEHMTIATIKKLADYFGVEIENLVNMDLRKVDEEDEDTSTD